MANAMDVLSMLLQKNSNPNDAQNGIGPATTNQLNKIGATAADAIGPYQKGVAKALQDLGQKHVQDAVAAGADPINDIQNHSIMNQQESNTTQTDPIQLLSGLVSMLPQQQQQSNINNLTDKQAQIKDNILGQLIQSSTSPKGFIEKFGQAFNNSSGANASQIANLQAMATAAGITPEQQYQQAGAQELGQSAIKQQLANAGKTPIQASELLSAQTSAQQKQIESQKAEIDAEKSNLQALIKTQGDVISHPVSMIMGGSGLKDIHKSIQQSMDRIKELQDNLNSQSMNYAKKVGAANADNISKVTQGKTKSGVTWKISGK